MRLADCFIEVLAYAKLYLRRPADDYDAFRTRVLAQLDESKRRALAAGFTSDEYQSALFAVVAWIDEAVMTSAWTGNARWRRELLQQAYFATGLAGVEFFTRLDQIAGHQQAVREVYYFCLMLGFKGRYVTRAQEKTLDELKQHHVAMLVRDAQHVAVADDAILFPQAYAVAPPATAKKRDTASIRARILFLGLPVAALVLLFLAFNLVLGSMVSGFSVFVR